MSRMDKKDASDRYPAARRRHSAQPGETHHRITGPLSVSRDAGHARSRRAIRDEAPPFLQGFKAVPPFITDINLSLDERILYVSCWGRGESRTSVFSLTLEASLVRFGEC